MDRRTSHRPHRTILTRSPSTKCLENTPLATIFVQSRYNSVHTPHDRHDTPPMCSSLGSHWDTLLALSPPSLNAVNPSSPTAFLIHPAIFLNELDSRLCRLETQLDNLTAPSALLSPKTSTLAELSSTPPTESHVRPPLPAQSSGSAAITGATATSTRVAIASLTDKEREKLLYPGRVNLTTYPDQHGINPHPLQWGASDPSTRGPIICSRLPGSIKARNAIGAHAGSYSIYRALSIAMGALDPTHKPDYSKTEPPVNIPFQPGWGDEKKIVSFDPWGHLVPQVFKSEMDGGLDIRPSIAVTKAHLKMSELDEAERKGDLVVDGSIVLRLVACVFVSLLLSLNSTDSHYVPCHPILPHRSILSFSPSSTAPRRLISLNDSPLLFDMPFPFPSLYSFLVRSSSRLTTNCRCRISLYPVTQFPIFYSYLLRSSFTYPLASSSERFHLGYYLLLVATLHYVPLPRTPFAFSFALSAPSISLPCFYDSFQLLERTLTLSSCRSPQPIKADGSPDPDARAGVEVNVSKAAIDPVWYLPGVAERFGISESLLRRALFEDTGGMYPELITRPDIKVFLPPIGGCTVYIFGNPAFMYDESKELTLRVHDECNGSDVFGSDICTCKPYLTYAIEECIRCAQRGGVGVVAYFRKEGRALGEVTKYLVYNLRKRGGDSADKYFKSTEMIAGVKDMRFQALMPDVLHWLGIKKIDNMVSMSDMKYDAIVNSGIPIHKRYDIPEHLIPPDSRVEIDAKIAAGYFSSSKTLTEKDLVKTVRRDVRELIQLTHTSNPDKVKAVVSGELSPAKQGSAVQRPISQMPAPEARKITLTITCLSFPCIVQPYSQTVTLFYGKRQPRTRSLCRRWRPQRAERADPNVQDVSNSSISSLNARIPIATFSRISVSTSSLLTREQSRRRWAIHLGQLRTSTNRNLKPPPLTHSHPALKYGNEYDERKRTSSRPSYPLTLNLNLPLNLKTRTPNTHSPGRNWDRRKTVSAALVPLTAAAFVTSGSANPVLDGVLGLSLVVHSHLGVRISFRFFSFLEVLFWG
ncbi:hypothetical protein NMY22_g13673 [Coprinellus aureogranulatus]|nr:hypothetical protein NMY22_g13673 [Coprinellus aureogranulatus]